MSRLRKSQETQYPSSSCLAWTVGIPASAETLRGTPHPVAVREEIRSLVEGAVQFCGKFFAPYTTPTSSSAVSFFSYSVMFTKVALFSMGMALLLAFANGQALTKECLGCMCEASTGCNTKQACNSPYCGPFLISWAYWADAGKPVIQNDHPDNKNAYLNCVDDLHCAATAVSNYMAKFQKDCNGDGAITCADFALIHKLGPHNCIGSTRDSDYWVKYTGCANALNLV